MALHCAICILRTLCVLFILHSVYCAYCTVGNESLGCPGAAGYMTEKPMSYLTDDTVVMMDRMLQALHSGDLS